MVQIKSKTKRGVGNYIKAKNLIRGLILFGIIGILSIIRTQQQLQSQTIAKQIQQILKQKQKQQQQQPASERQQQNLKQLKQQRKVYVEEEEEEKEKEEGYDYEKDNEGIYTELPVDSLSKITLRAPVKNQTTISLSGNSSGIAHQATVENKSWAFNNCDDLSHPYMQNATVAVCGGSVCPIAGLSIFSAQTCNEAYNMPVDWVVEINDNRLGSIDISQSLDDRYCKKSSLESWGVVANSKTEKRRVACGFETINPLDLECNSYRQPEYHAFVLWDPSLWISQESFLGKTPSVEVVDTFVVTDNHKKWCVTIYGDDNNARYHGYCMSKGNPKVVVVRDPNPEYGTWKTPGANQVLNKNIYSLKTKMRSMSKSGFKAVHSSNNVEETMLVLEPLNRQYGPPPPEFKTIKDLFDSFDQHSCFRYVVLRSHEEVNQGSVSKDIDILVNDFYMFKAITGAKSNHKKTMREFDNGPNTQNIIGGKWKFDVRYVGDGYYDTAWQLHMLQHRVKSGGVWVQEPLSYAMSLLYYYNVHKRPPSSVDPSRWYIIHQKLPLLVNERSWRSRTALQAYMTAHGYNVTRPHDTGVGYRLFKALQTVALETNTMEKCLRFKGRKTAHHECNNLHVTTEIGEAIVKKEPSRWTRKCGDVADFPKFCDRPYGEYIFSEASNYVNVSGVPLSVAREFSIKPEEENSLYSVQLKVGELTKFDPIQRLDTAFSRLGAGILDYLLDNCDRLGHWPDFDMKFIPKSGKYNNFAKDKAGSTVWFDNAKSMGCHGTESLKAANLSVISFWEGWCHFPLSFHVKGLSSFLFEQLALPNAYINEDAMRGLQWREQALLEYMEYCRQGKKEETKKYSATKKQR